MAVTDITQTRGFDRWLPVMAVGAVAAYAISRRFTGERAHGKGTGAIADYGSDTRRQLGGRRGIHVEHAVTINRPIGEVYRYWRNFENLPKFMSHLELVAQREEGISHWVAKGPAGMTVEWDARIINEIDNRVIAWQSLAGSRIATAGSVNFEESDRGTVVHVHLQYNPPGGRFGAAVAWLFGEEPNQQVRYDMRRFKQLMETGEVSTIAGQTSGRREARGGDR